MEKHIDPYQSLQCILCKHNRGLACLAYPFGVPLMIMAGLEPCQGNNGVKFRIKGEPKGERKHLRLIKK